MEHEVRLKAALADRYSIDREIGSGGMATVYLAQDLKHDRKVAVKVLDPDLTRTLGAERFLKEIKTAANLTHPHILPVHDSGEADGFLFYVMPFIKGESLRSRLTKEKQLPVEDAVQITREIADALAYAHEEGVIHRDVKPANIMLEAGHAVLADFGVAHAVAEAKDKRLTRTGTSLGTPAYMSPEQAAGEQGLDGRSDQYALGCVLFEMLAGHPPFTGAQVEAVLRQHLTEEPPSVTKARPTVANAVARVINRALAKSPADRYRTAGEMAAELALTNRPSQSSPPGLSLQGRPIWQILGGWALGSLAILGASGTLRDLIGLPAWVPTAAGLICLGSLPLVLGATLKLRQQLSWRIVGLVTGVAFVLLAMGTVGYMGMRVMGVGPAGTLIGKGVLGERTRVVVAEIDSRHQDTLVASAITEALRIGLVESEVLQIVDPAEVAELLALMQLPPDTRLNETVARQAAIRFGAPVVLLGTLTPVGSGYQLVGRLVDAEEGTSFVEVIERAASENELLDAADRIAGALRERVGESLRSVQNREPLSRSTTSSIEALKKFVQGSRAHTMEGDSWKAVALLEEALSIDSTFAAAWRKLGAVLNPLGVERERRIEALTRAFEFSDRLPPRERYEAIGSYYWGANVDYKAAADVYERAVEEYPENGPWINLGFVYGHLGRYEDAVYATRRSVEISPSGLNTENLLDDAFRARDLEAAEYALAVRREHLPGLENAYFEYMVTYLWDSRASALELLEMREDGGEVELIQRELGRLAALEGRLAEAESHFDQAISLTSPLAAMNHRFWLAGLDLLVRDSLARARREVTRWMDEVDISGIPPIDRPYLSLAWSLADVGEAFRAQELLAAWEDATPIGIRPTTRASELNVRGKIALAQGDSATGLDFLRESVRAGHGAPSYEGGLARWYDHFDMADSALAAHHRYLDAPHIDRTRDDPYYLARAYERLGQLHEARGEMEEAVRYHTLFVDLWAEADPELQPRVEAARQALEPLQSTSSTPGG
ncbi:MAG: serine/threonine-protein kinase [Gemmatimonadota bacterium]|jgi:tetratricopeptide (TPR) repeat protein